MANVFGFLIGLGLVAILFSLLVGIAYYILFSLPLYWMATRANMENAWLAWIPIARVYVYCMLSSDDFVLFGSWKFPERIYGFIGYVVILILQWCLGGVPLLSFVCSIACIILLWRMSYDLIRRYNRTLSDTGVMVLSVFSGIFSIVRIVVLWMYHSSDPVDPYFSA